MGHIRLLAVLAIFLITLATPRAAQSYFACGVDGVTLTVFGGSPFMGFTPAAPNASQAVVLTVGMVNYNPLGAIAVVQGNAINVTFNASYLGFATPPALSCSTVAVGPLPAGNYVVNLILVGPGQPAPVSVAVGTLAVASASAAIPATSHAALAVLALLLLVAGCSRIVDGERLKRLV